MSKFGLEMALLVLAVLAALIGLVFLRLSRTPGAQKRIHDEGTPARVVASDTGALPPVVLVDSVLGIRGKPDYLLEERTPSGRRLTALEVKPTRRSPRLYETDRVQIAAYVIAARAMFGENASRFGYVEYSDKSFRVDLTAELEDRVRAIVTSIRGSRQNPSVRRTHTIASRCRACAMRAHCDDSLD